MLSASLFFGLVLLVLAAVLVYNSVKIVPQGFEYTVERFGRYTRTLTPGLWLLVPVMDRVGLKMNMMEQVIDIPSQDIITRDNAQVTADAVAFIQVMDAASAAYEVANLDRAISNLALTNVRTVLGSMDLDEILSNRDAINERLLRVIDLATNPWGVKVTRVEIKDLTPPHDITEAMAKQMKAEREKRAEILAAEGDKSAAILRAEGEKQSAILEAEGRREAAFRDAEAREREAEAEAKATEMVSEAIAKGDVQAVNYFVAQSYVEAFGKLAEAKHQKTVIIPAETAGLVGLLSGITELKGMAGPGTGGGTSGPGGSTGGSTSMAGTSVPKSNG
ncbi:SPFH/Band 7/PHB domain protein [Pyruvatibacter mobilis]|uniref:Protein QmcA n=1 Tax=Pyruvatibacter mobilis TaxID=1712261 RepID=A0A845QCM4_9HYPH|nr:SPFH domain-containing protein [Pyruvatibacter mobilis]NBG96363.1 SPFH/Band 7/PHB domain protein [Pyruvatibacter mobilis]QJD75848.1 SPFH/Band 7/PHB domain protein [Pyruvatibacter mobilis]GGD19100.1 membrane protein [Pyruvatibacter mobilis]